MARLPGVADLGNAPVADQVRPVATTDVSAVARAGAALAEGGRQLGAGIAKAGEGAADLGLAEDRWDYAKAHADFLAKKVDLDAATRTDNNYGPDANGKALPQRYEDQVGELQNGSAAMIRSAPMRERFLSELRPTVQQGIATATQHAKARESDANVAYVSQQGDAIMDRAVKAPDDNTRRQLIDSHNQLVDGLLDKGAITEVQAVAMKKAWAHQYATADVLARADSDPQGVINELRAKPGSPDQVVNRIAQVEGLVKNPKSSAIGTGQFIDGTWLDVLKRNRPDLAQGKTDDEILDLRADKKLGLEMTGYYAKENGASLQRQGLPVTPGNTYLAHFLGPAGAAAVLKGDPNKPVLEVLSKALGPDKAQAMVDANRSVLGGQLAGSVRQWADGKMGGATPGGGGVYDMLRPDVREQVLSTAMSKLDTQTATDISGFKSRYDDTLAEASRNGTAQKPLLRTDFIGTLGAEKGPAAFDTYTAEMKYRNDVLQVARMTPQQQDELVRSYEPAPGAAGFAEQAKRQERIKAAVAKQVTEDAPAFKAKVEDTLAEAGRNGAPKTAVTKAEFVRALGAKAGSDAFDDYVSELGYRKDISKLPTSPQEQSELVARYGPKPGEEDFAVQVKRQAELQKAIAQVRKERDQDPAAYAIARIPSVTEAWSTFAQVASDPQANEATRQAAARDFLTKTTLEQQKAGVAATDVRVLPNGYTESFKARLDKPQEAGGTANVVKQIVAEARLWGNGWPQVYRQLAKEIGPLPRVIGSMTDDGGTIVNETAARKLVELAPLKLTDILKDESTEKSNQVKKDVLTAFTPFIRTMAGNEGAIGVFNDFRTQGEKLSAYYIVNGMSSADASVKAFKELIGDRYEFRDSWRVPKGITQSADDVQRGSVQAMRDLDAIGIKPPRDNVGGLSADYVAKSKTDAIRRDGKWVTAPDESGLALIYNDEAVRGSDGRPLVLSWSQLGTIAENKARSNRVLTDELRATAGTAGP